MKQIYIMVILAVMIAPPVYPGQAEPRMDGRNLNAWEISKHKVEKSLSPDEQKEFKRAHYTIFRKASETAMPECSPKWGRVLFDEMKAYMHGKTAAEIIEVARALDAADKLRARSAAYLEIKKLRARRDGLDSVEQAVSAFQVVHKKIKKRSLRVDEQNPGLFRLETILNVTINNRTAFQVRAVTFRCTLTVPGQAEPWAEETFDFALDEGVEPGETVILTMKMDKLGSVAINEQPPEAELTVTPVSLKGAGGAELFTVESFTKQDAERLDMLLDKYGDPDDQPALSKADTQARHIRLDYYTRMVNYICSLIS